MNTNKYLGALSNIYEEYDAFYIMNKYGENTHKEEFKLLEELFKNDEKASRVINYLKNCYDCYYKYEESEKSYFNYLEERIRGILNEENSSNFRNN